MSIRQTAFLILTVALSAHGMGAGNAAHAVQTATDTQSAKLELWGLAATPCGHASERTDSETFFAKFVAPPAKALRHRTPTACASFLAPSRLTQRSAPLFLLHCAFLC